MLQKVYVHHYYSKSLFYKIAHNTSNRKYLIDNNIGSIFCKYNNKDLEFIFNPQLNDNEDGYHLIDFLTILSQINVDEKFSSIDCINKKKGDNAHRGKWGAEFGINDIPIMKWISDTLENRKGWFIFLLRTEKSFIQYDMPTYWQILDLESQIRRLKNHIILSDNYFIDKSIGEKYPNHKFILTNTIHQWNELLSIRWYYEFKNVFEKLNPPYDLCFSMRYHKKNRTELIKNLANLKNNRIFLSRTNNCKNNEFFKEETDLNKHDNININNWYGDNFDDMDWIENIEHYLDYIMRILPMSKLHILSETWDWYNGELSSNYLSEKTYGLVLSNIPFIPTHTYPLDILQETLGVERYPFYEDIKKSIGNTNNFILFINKFFEDYDNNLLICKNWVNRCHLNLMDKINKENSFLNNIEDILQMNNNVTKTKKII
jgi:hypothetical protein